MLVFLKLICVFGIMLIVFSDVDIDSLEKMIKSGEASKVISLIEQDIDANYTLSSEVMVILARSYATTGRLEKGEEVLMSILEQDENCLNASITLSKIYIQRKQWRQADALLKNVLIIDEFNSQALVQLSKVFIGQYGNVDKAIELVKKAVSINPNDERAHFELGMLYFQLNEHQLGKDEFDLAARLNPTMDFKLLGRVYLHFNHIDWAADALQKSIDRAIMEDKKPDSETLILLAECRDVLGSPEEAMSIYEDLLQREPSNALAHAGKGLLLLGISSRNYGAIHACGLNQEDAVKHLNMAVTIDYNIKPAVAALHFCYEEFGETKSWRNIVKDHNKEDSQTTSSYSSSTSTSTSLISSMQLKLFISLQKLKEKLFKLAKLDQLCVKLSSTIDTRIPFLSLWTRFISSICHLQGKSQVSEANEEATKKQIHNIRKRWTEREMTMEAVSELSQPVSVEDFFKTYLKENRPVLIKGGQAGWGGDGGKDAFSTANLVKTFGDEVVRVSVSQSGRFDGPEPGSLWGLDDDTEVLVRPPATSMLFGDFITLVANRSSHVGSRLTETFYLEYSALHQYLGKEFLNLIPLPKFIEEKHPSVSARAKEHLLTPLLSNVWIGSKPTVSPLHYDDYENLLCQIRGNKELILFPPSDLPYLYYNGRPKGTLKYKYPTTFVRDSSTLNRQSIVFGSSINVDKPDLKLHPLYKKASPIRVFLQPGDILYLPAFWHHEVQSIPDDGDASYKGLNIAVNFWFENKTAPIDDVGLLGVSLV